MYELHTEEGRAAALEAALRGLLYWIHVGDQAKIDEATDYADSVMSAVDAAEKEDEPDLEPTTDGRPK